jgi:hypothetical protein
MTRRTTTGSCRVTLPPIRHQWTDAPAPGRPWPAFGGDELRVRAYLWRVLGVGAAASAGRPQ